MYPMDARHEGQLVGIAKGGLVLPAAPKSWPFTIIQLTRCVWMSTECQVLAQTLQPCPQGWGSYGHCPRAHSFLETVMLWESTPGRLYTKCLTHVIVTDHSILTASLP